MQRCAKERQDLHELYLLSLDKNKTNDEQYSEQAKTDDVNDHDGCFAGNFQKFSESAENAFRRRLRAVVGHSFRQPYERGDV